MIHVQALIHNVRGFVLWHWRIHRHACGVCGKRGDYGTRRVTGRLGMRTGDFYLCRRHDHS